MHGAPCAAVGLGRGAFPRQGVAVPAVESEAAAQFALLACLFVVVPLRAGFGAFSVVGVGVFVQPCVIKMQQPVEHVSLQGS